MGPFRQRVGVCLLLVALVTSGCQAPLADASDETATPNGTATAADNGTATLSAPNITVSNGSLELDPGRVFARVQAVSGTNVTAPDAVRVFDNGSEFYNSTPGGGLSPGVPRFWRLAGLSTTDVNGSALEISKNGYVTGQGTVAIYLSPNTTLADERLLLAHEFTHYVQIQREQQSSLNDALDRRTTQTRYLTRSIIEGGAVYTTDTYVEEYAPDAKLNSPWYDEIQASYPAGHVARFQNARYILGHEYVSTRVESPANLSAVYQDPPRTSEQLLHGLAPGAEPPTALNVTSTTGDDWLASGSDTLGESFVRYALAGNVSQSRAARAAAGWGNDSLRLFRPFGGGDTGYVWVLDWDDSANATEFERTVRDAFDARGNATDGIWSLPDVNASATVTEVSEETTALVLGPERFVTATTVTADDDGRDGVRVAVREG